MSKNRAPLHIYLTGIQETVLATACSTMAVFPLAPSTASFMYVANWSSEPSQPRPPRFCQELDTFQIQPSKQRIDMCLKCLLGLSKITIMINNPYILQ